MFIDRKSHFTRILAQVLSFCIVTSNLMLPTVALAAPPAANPKAEGLVKLIIKLKKGLSDSDAGSAIAGAHGARHHSVAALHRHVMTVPASRAAEALSVLQQDPRVESVETDHVRRVESVSNDPSYGVQWALPKIGWDQVYGIINLSGTSILAVIDTGVQSSDLALVPGWSAFGSDPLVDANGHGTKVASIAAATAGNELGIAGVGFSNVSVMPIQALSPDGTGQDSDIISGIIWAADNGANVIVMAFSDPGYSAALQEAVSYAWNKGVVVVAAAGNDGGSSPNYPAGDTNVVGVGATDQDDAMWSGSNISPAVFITAPGVDIEADTNVGDVTAVTGTSAAAAVVAGAAALLRANDGAATPGMIVNRLAANADPVGMANGRVNLARAIADTSTTEIAPAGAQNGGPYVGPYQVAANRKIKVTLAGIAQASITSNPSGISCNSSNTPCTQNFNTTQAVTLTAVLNPGATSITWSGACSGSSLTCNLPASSADQNVTATIAGKYESTTTVTCPASVVYNGALQTPCTASWSSPLPSNGTLTPSYSNNQSVGTANANANYSGDANNTSSSGTATFQITKAPLSVSFTVQNKTYDGSTNATITGCSLTGVVSQDTNNVSCVYSGATATLSDARAGNRTVTAIGFTLSGPAAGNYSIGTISTASATIAPKSLAVNFTANNKTYDATTTATIASCSLAGIVGTDNVHCISGGATANFSDKNAGSGKTVTASGFSLGGNLASSYVIDTINTTTANISALSLTLAFSSPDRVYNASTAAAITGCSLTGVLSGDAVSCSTAGASAAFADKTVGTAKTVTGTGFALAGANAGNYSISPPYTTSANITPFSLTISAMGSDKYFDGTAAATVSLTDNRISGDLFTSSYASASFDTPNVGTGKTVSVSGISISGQDAANYVYNTSATTTASIKSNSVSISFTVDDKVYDGTNSAAINNCQVIGVNSGDVVTCNLSAVTATFSDKTVGAGKTVTGAGFALAGANAASYTLASTSATTTGSINPRPLHVTATGSSRPYDGMTSATVTLSDDRVSGDVLTVNYDSAKFANANAGVGKVIDVLGIAVSGPDAGNYTPNSSATTTADITQVELTVTADDQSRLYGSANPTLNATITGFILGESLLLSDLAGVPSCSTSASQSSAVGSYAIACTQGTLASSNYSFTFMTGSLHITPASLTITADADPSTPAGDHFVRNYGQANPTFTARFDGLVNGDTASVLGGALVLSTSATSSSPVGSYAITVSGVTSGNYTITFAQGQLDISKVPLLLNANASSKTYGSSDPSLTGTLVGFVNGEDASSAGVSGAPSCSRASGENSGTYSITCSQGTLAATNYSFSTGESAIFTINKATLLVNEANDLSKVYGESDPTFTYNLAGFIGTDNETNSGITGSGNCSRNPGEDVGTYTIKCVPGTLEAQNYNFSQGTTGNFTITKAKLLINAVSASKLVNAPDPNFGSTLSGFVFSDTATSSNIAGAASCTRAAGETVGSYKITCTAGTLSAPNYSFATGATANLSILYAFTGFAGPVNMSAVNVANAGRAIPLSFSVKDALGNGIANLPGFKIYQVIYQCGDTSNVLTNDVTVYAAGASGLQNLGGGLYQYNWNTDKNYKGSCRQIQVNAGDGIVHVADFQFK